MNSHSYLLCLVILCIAGGGSKVSGVEVSSGEGCAEDVNACLGASLYNTTSVIIGAALCGLSPAHCAMMRNTVGCLQGIEGPCYEAHVRASNLRRQIADDCPVFGVEGCRKNDYETCASQISQGIEIDCPEYECVLQLRNKCKGAGWGSYYQGDAKEHYDDLQDKCGCGNLQASVLAILTTVLIVLGVRSYC